MDPFHLASGFSNLRLFFTFDSILPNSRTPPPEQVVGTVDPFHPGQAKPRSLPFNHVSTTPCAPPQIVDTVDLFHAKRSRKLSLRFLASYLLRASIQEHTHDSIEDAATALK